MFTGIIPITGSIVKIQNTKRGRFITIKTNSKIAQSVPEGGSVSVDGVCLTRLPFRHPERSEGSHIVHDKYGILQSPRGSFRMTKSLLTFELMDSTLKRTTFGERKVGDRVNVEPAMIVGQPIGGHFISGHVDGVGRVSKVATRWHTRYMVIGVSRDLYRYLVPQGSIVVNGVALTVVEVGASWFSVALTSYTLKHTNLSDLTAGDKVNIEVDMLAKYLEKFIAQYALRNHRRKF